MTVLGLTFKETVPDTRNSRVVDIVRELTSFGLVVQVADPLAIPEEAQHEYGVALTPLDQLQPADAVVLAVSHREYVTGGWPLIMGLLRGGTGVVFDVKGLLARAGVPSGIDLWRL